jgi:hypothetical protein
MSIELARGTAFEAFQCCAGVENLYSFGLQSCNQWRELEFVVVRLFTKVSKRKQS